LLDTGASSGIGEALAKNLALCNARLAISSEIKDELVRVKRECLALNSNLKEQDILVLDFDMLHYSAHESSFQKVIKHFGKLDLLISNAGRSQKASWQSIELEVDRSIFDLNVFSIISLNRIVVRYFYESGNKGRLAVTSSIAGVIGTSNGGSYTGSKHALHGYFEGLRNETRDKNIAITILCPGPVFTDIMKKAFTSKQGEVNELNSPGKRKMTTDRCAFLCLVAIANKLEESWLAMFPLVIFTHLLRNHSFLMSKIIDFFVAIGRFKSFT